MYTILRTLNIVAVTLLALCALAAMAHWLSDDDAFNACLGNHSYAVCQHELSR